MPPTTSGFYGKETIIQNKIDKMNAAGNSGGVLGSDPDQRGKEKKAAYRPRFRNSSGSIGSS